MRVLLEQPGPAVDRTAPVTVAQEGPGEPTGQFLGHFEQRHHLPRAGRAFHLQVVAVIPVVGDQGPDQEHVDGEPDRAAPVGVAAEHPGSRLGRLVLHAVFRTVNVEGVGVIQVPARDRADPVRAQEALLVQHPGQDAAQLGFVDQRQDPPTADAGHERVGDIGQQVLITLEETAGLRGDRRVALDQLGLDHGRGADRQQAHQGTHLDPGPGAVGQAQHVVEEAVLLVPHLVGVLSDRVHGGGDPEEALDELEHELLIARILLQQGQGHFEHVLAEHRHPGRAVRLFQPPAGGQRGAAVEHPDIVQAEEAALEYVVAAGILAVHPPGEVQQQPGEALPEERHVHLA